MCQRMWAHIAARGCIRLELTASLWWRAWEGLGRSALAVEAPTRAAPGGSAASSLEQVTITSSSSSHRVLTLAHFPA